MTYSVDLEYLLNTDPSELDDEELDAFEEFVEGNLDYERELRMVNGLLKKFSLGDKKTTVIYDMYGSLKEDEYSFSKLRSHGKTFELEHGFSQEVGSVFHLSKIVHNYLPILDFIRLLPGNARVDYNSKKELCIKYLHESDGEAEKVQVELKELHQDLNYSVQKARKHGDFCELELEIKLAKGEAYPQNYQTVSLIKELVKDFKDDYSEEDFVEVDI